ncbi:hypothetical protein F5Y08DRAFT_297303 [Xylaria arbuscula]|nr:hypothetical protein F5Y08DRAFT_297303 [Xylaria arbuscula]
MDPLSVIASIAGISTAGITLSRAIYDAISSIRNAPKEVSSVAKGLCDLSVILRELRRVLKDGKDVYRRKLIRRVASAIRRVGRVQSEIKELLDGTGTLAKLKWIFQKSRVMELLYAIESHKTGINIILQTMVLAVQLKQLSENNTKTAITNRANETDDNILNDAILARHQAENMVQISFHSLQDLKHEVNRSGLSPEEGEENSANEEPQTQQVQLRNPQTSDDALWLCDLVFSPAIEAAAELTQINPSLYSSSEDGEGSSTAISSSQVIVTQYNSSLTRLNTLTQQQQPESSMVINELLSEWTTLTENEIEGIDRAGQKGKIASPEPMSNSTEDVVQMVNFKDAVGRKFELPFQLIRDWAGMEKIIKQMFLHVEVIGPHVQAGHYDLLNSRGNIVLPALWELSVKPTDSFYMEMWPMDLPQSVPQRRPVGPEPGSIRPRVLPPQVIDVRNLTQPKATAGKHRA